MEFFISNWPIWLCVGIILFLAIVGFTCYVKAPPSYAYVLSGLRKEPRVLRGNGGIKVPILERLDKVYAGQLSVDVKTEESVPTNDFINVKVDAVAKVQVTPSQEGIRLASKNFLNMDPKAIASELRENLQGNLRELIGALDLKTLNIDRDNFANKVMEKAQPDMTKLGITILAFNIQNIKDEQGLIENLGADNTWKIRQDAAITKANAEKNIAEAQAENKKLANQATTDSEKAIAEQNADLLVKQSEQKKRADIQQAIADAAYDIEFAEQQLVINQKTVAADTAKTIKEQELTNEMIKVTENKKAAEKRAVEITSEANKAQTEINAAADLERRKREAEAKLYEAEKAAEARKKQADADLYAKQQEAAGIKAVGDAEGEAIRAKLVGEADGMMKKAEAYQMYNDAAMASMIVEKMPDVADSLAKQVGAIKGINIYSTGGQNGSGIPMITGNLPTMMAQLFDTFKSATGIDIAEKLGGHKNEVQDVTPISVETTQKTTKKSNKG